MPLMDVGTTFTVSRRIPADPDTLYDLISDVTRHGEWSPECRGGRWIEPGVTFRGRNRWGLIAWSRTCHVDTAVPGERFVFHTVPEGAKQDSTRWSYLLEATGGDTVVTESYEILIPVPPRMQTAIIARLLPHHLDMRPHMEASLAGIEAIATNTATNTARAHRKRPARH